MTSRVTSAMLDEPLLAWGERRTLAEWSALTGVTVLAIRRRLAKGMPAELALSVPLHSHVRLDVPPGAPGSWTWAALDFEDDDWALSFVQRHPHGASLDAVAETLGVVRAAVDLIERAALSKLRDSMKETP
ncbi:MAG TPA: hypothetical protein VK524_09420 [Polyangiaceae bacterium]|nr:hypothetical protein [Polyangiaceae bacterium]